MMRAATVVKAVPLIAGALVFAGCHDDQTAPSPGEIAITVVTTGVDLDRRRSPAHAERDGR